MLPKTNSNDDWKLNLGIEKSDLEYKIDRLIDHLESDHPMTATQTVLLEMQLKHMKNYASCLNLRIEDLKQL